MNHEDLIDAALVELSEWRSHSRNAARFPDGLYAAIRTELEALRELPFGKELAVGARRLSRRVVDSGPLSGEFLPSFFRLWDGLGRLEARERKA